VSGSSPADAWPTCSVGAGSTQAVTALDPSRTSLVGGIVYMFQVARGSLGLGIASAVFTARADQLSSNVERVVRASFESGFQATFLLVAALALAGFVVTVPSSAGLGMRASKVRDSAPTVRRPTNP
jgi:hypothetical protein